MRVASDTRHRWIKTCVAPLLPLLFACSAGVQQSRSEGEQVEAPRDAQEAIRHSSFIFRGTVKRPRASNTRNLAASESTSVVTVDRVLRRPGTLDDFTGKDITILLREPAAKGTAQIFVTEVVSYAGTLGVAEVGRLAASEDTAAVRRSIEGALQEEADRALRTRIDSAVLVIVGRVDSVRPAPPEVRGVPASEHWPDWWEALIQVESVLKGDSESRSVVVLFPNSTDVVWYDAPKFRKGQEGIWILQRVTTLGAEVARYLTALRPLDFQPRDQLPRVKRLIQAK
jgi:hypothetical protein